MRDERVDLVVLCPLLWSSDRLLFAALRELGDNLPLVLWCYTPFRATGEKVSLADIWSNGTVGALQTASTLKRLGRDFSPVAGHSIDTVATIREHCIAAKAASDLKKPKIDIIPWRHSDNSGGWIDEAKSLRKLGSRIEPISFQQLHQASLELREEEIKSFVDYLKKNFKVTVSDKSLLAASSWADAQVQSSVRRAHCLKAKHFNRTTTGPEIQQFDRSNCRSSFQTIAIPARSASFFSSAI